MHSFIVAVYLSAVVSMCGCVSAVDPKSERIQLIKVIWAVFVVVSAVYGQRVDSSKMYEVMIVRLDFLAWQMPGVIATEYWYPWGEGRKKEAIHRAEKKTYFGEGTHGGLLLRYLIAAWLKVKYVIIRRFQGLIVCGSIVWIFVMVCSLICNAWACCAHAVHSSWLHLGWCLQSLVFVAAIVVLFPDFTFRLLLLGTPFFRMVSLCGSGRCCWADE